MLTYIINELQAGKSGILTMAFDGRSASGKTTAALKLAETFDANVFHLDDFFLPICKKTKELMSIPGNNFDRERFFDEVLVNIKKGKEFSYSPFDCATQNKKPPVFVTPKRLNIVEGAYSLHPSFCDYYDLKVFFTVDKATQAQRILLRNGAEMQKRFLNEWIPKEEEYFSAFNTEQNADFVILRR